MILVMNKFKAFKIKTPVWFTGIDETKLNLAKNTKKSYIFPVLLDANANMRF